LLWTGVQWVMPSLCVILGRTACLHTWAAASSAPSRCMSGDSGLAVSLLRGWSVHLRGLPTGHDFGSRLIRWGVGVERLPDGSGEVGVGRSSFFPLFRGFALRSERVQCSNRRCTRIVARVVSATRAIGELRRDCHGNWDAHLSGPMASRSATIVSSRPWLVGPEMRECGVFGGGKGGLESHC
jgi:hypothetical protein